jgi:hypothetical protein
MILSWGLLAGRCFLVHNKSWLDSCSSDTDDSHMQKELQGCWNGASSETSAKTWLTSRCFCPAGQLLPRKRPSVVVVVHSPGCLTSYFRSPAAKLLAVYEAQRYVHNSSVLIVPDGNVAWKEVLALASVLGPKAPSATWKTPRSGPHLKETCFQGGKKHIMIGFL